MVNLITINNFYNKTILQREELKFFPFNFYISKKVINQIINMAKVSDKAVGRSKGGNLLPGGSITGNLDEIIDDINNSIKNVEAGVDLIFHGNVDSQKSFSEFIDAFNKTRSQASEEFMSMMGFVSGGQSISENTSYDNIKTNIQSFTKSISENLDKTNKILTSDGMQVIVTNFNEQKLKKEKPQNVEVKVPEIKPVINIPDYSRQLDVLRFIIEKSNKTASDNIIKVLTTKNEIKEKPQNVEVKVPEIKPVINIPDYSRQLDVLRFTIEKSNKTASDNIIKVLNSNTNNQTNPVDLNNLHIKIDDLNLSKESKDVLKDLSNALNSVAKVKYEVKDQNIVKYLTGIDKSISKIDIDNLKKKISKVNKLLTNDFLKLCNTINSASIDSKKNMSQLSSVVELMNAIPSIGEIDKQKMKTLKKNLHSIYWMTSKSNILTGLGITSKGIISAIIENIVARSKEAGQGGFKSIGALAKFIESLVSLGEDTNVDRTKIMKTQMALWSLLRIYDVKGPIAYLTLQIKELGDNILKDNVVGKNNSSLSAIEDMIEDISTIGNHIKFKDVVYNQLLATYALGSAWIYMGIVKFLSKIDDTELKKLIGDNGKLAFVMQVVQRLSANESTSKDIKSATKTLVQLTIMMSVANMISKVSKNGIVGVSDALVFLDKLDFLGQKIFTMQDSAINDESVPNIMKNCEDVILSLGKIAVVSTIAGMFVDKGKEGVSNMKTMVTQLKYLVNNINNKKNPLIASKDDVSKIESCQKIVESLTKLSILAAVGGLFAVKGQDGIREYKKVLTKLKSLIKRIQSDGLDVKQEDLKKIDNIEKLIEKLTIVSMWGSVMGITAPLSIIGFKSMQLSGVAVGKMIDTLSKIEINDDFFDKLKNIGIVVAIASATMLAGAVIGKIVLQRMPEILGFTFALGTFILGVIGAYNLATKGMDEALEQSKKVALLIYMSGATLLLGAAIMMIPGIFTNAVLFTLSLAAFIGAVTFAYTLASERIERTIEISDSFIKLVVKSGLILAFGAAVNAFLPTGSVLGFAFSLTLLISGVITAYSIASNMMEDTMSSAEEFAWLIGIAGLTLLLPTIYMTKHPVMFATALWFAFELGVFVFLMKLAYSSGDFAANYIGAKLGAKLGVVQSTDKAIDDAKNFAILVGISGAILLLGAAIMNIDGMFWSAIGFTLTLGAFLLGISAAYWGANKMLGGQKGMMIAHEFSNLVALSAATLLVGGLFMMIPNMGVATVSFAGILCGFVAGITLAYGFAGKIINEKTLFLGYALSALVLVSSIALLNGGMLMMNYPDLGSYILQFLGLELLLVGGTAVILGILSVVKGKLKTGALALIGVIACVRLAGYAMMEIMNLRKEIGDDWGGIWATIGTTIAVLIAFAAGLRYLSAGTGGLGALALAAGEAALAGIIGCVLLAGKAMQEIIKVMDMASKLERVDTSIITDDIKAMLSIIWELKPFMNPLIDMLIVAASGTITSLGYMMSKLSEGIQDYANLSIPIYGEGGKIVGRRNLTDADFTDAAENIKTIITILGGTILDTYKENPDIFSNGMLGDFLGMDTPFTRVVKSCTGMGKMIDKIAEGVKDMADLKIAIYKGTDKVGYRRLIDDDFNSAAANISTIVTCLGYAILDLYDKAPEGMFDSGWLGNMIGVKTPFGRVVTGCTGLGKMISSIAKGVKDMADLRIPIYGSDGKQKGTRPLDFKDFINAAFNTQLIVSCLGNAIMSLGSNSKTAWMFEDQSLVFKDGTCSRFSQIVTALKGIGSLISETAKGVKDVADLRIQKYDANGKLLKGQYEKIPVESLRPKGAVYKNVTALMSCIPAAVMSIYDAHSKDWFEDAGWFSNDGSTSPFAKVKNCLSGLDKLVAANVKSIKSILDLKLDPIKMIELSNIITVMISSVPDAVMKATMNENQEELNPFFENAEDNIKKISSSYSSYTKLLNNIVSSYSDILKLKSKFGKEDDIHGLNKIVDAVLTQLPFSMSRAIQKMPNIKDDELSSIQEQFDIYTDILNDAIKSYKKIIKFKQKLEKETKDNAASIVISLSDIPKEMVKGISETFVYLNTKNLSKNILMFGPMMEDYYSGMKMLFDVYDEAPKDTSKYDNVINAVKGINVEISKVKNTSQFRIETQDVSKFTRSINTLDVAKAQTMTNLITALDQMARRLGGLDKLTNTLANKLAVVLDKLVRELKISAKTINQADEMQKKRHAAIKDSISKISTLLNKPVEVNVKQVQDTENSTMQYSDTSTPGQNSAERDETPAGGNPLNSQTQQSKE